MKKISHRLLLFFLLLTLIYIILYKYANNPSHATRPKRLSSDAQQCDPILSDAKQETFLINGVSYPKYVPIFVNTSYNFTCMNENKRSKVIFLWNKLYNMPDFNYGIGKEWVFKRNGCPVWNCEITNNRKRIHESDIVVFSIWDEIDELPKWRQPHQKWVYMMEETPKRYDEQIILNENYARRNLSKYNGLFNLSATYRADSNFTPVYVSEYAIYWKENNNFNGNKNYLKYKTEFAFQIISHCNALSKRDDYIKELQKYAQIDVFGKCGRACPNSDDRWFDSKCKTSMVGKYKFYMSFENSICKDYVTEKFYNMFNYDIIPVVYGAGPYDLLVPKSAYINAFDFESPRHLAEYMIKVGSDSRLYSSFFEWKRFVVHVPYPRMAHICEMCILLNLEQYYGIKYSVIEHVDTFWASKKDCKTLDTKTFKLHDG